VRSRSAGNPTITPKIAPATPDRASARYGSSAGMTCPAVTTAVM